MNSRPSLPIRQQLLIDHRVQGTLLRRAALYSTACAMYLVVILVFTESMSNPKEPVSESIIRCMDEAIYWAPGLMLLMPVIAYDLLKLSNRFAGPAFRLRREMQRLVDGESKTPLNFRDGDYWVEMADIFNAIREELLERRQAQSSEAKAEAQVEVRSRQKLFASDEAITPTEEVLAGLSD